MIDKTLAVWTYPDLRQVCQGTAKGRREYGRRHRIAWESQCRNPTDPHSWCPWCLLKLEWNDSSVDHIKPRQMGGGGRDDRQENIRAVHPMCNSERGSRRQLTRDNANSASF